MMPLSESHPAKAMLHNLDHQDQPAIKCMFNPKEYSIAKTNKWSVPPAKGKNIGEYEFGGGDPAKMTLQLLFDTFEDGDDVRTYTDGVWKLMLIDASLQDPKSGNKGRPPRVRFQWGKSFSFDAVITNITQKFLLFKEDGVPVRATLDVGFQQVRDENEHPGQNPTSGGLGGGRQWTVKEGDTLTSIAYAEYGDSSSWRRIADANRLTQVRRLRPGTILELPSLADG
jgi:Contractile injection system tube protein/LysM domain